jgi:DNA uptake protein ComE-like DNA-binding protein
MYTVRCEARFATAEKSDLKNMKLCWKERDAQKVMEVQDYTETYVSDNNSNPSHLVEVNTKSLSEHLQVPK